MCAQRHSGHTVDPPLLGDTGIDRTVGCICFHMSLPLHTGRLETRKKKQASSVVSLGLSESNIKRL